MNETPIFTDEQWNTLIQNVAATYDDVTLKKGFLYERIGVQQLTVSEDRTLHAEVKEGSSICQVELALDAPADGSCTCVDRKPCRHQAAALMRLARLRGRPVSALANASATASSGAKVAKTTEEASSRFSSEKASEESGQDSSASSNEESRKPQPGIEQASVLAAAPVSTWIRRFEQAAAALSGRTRNPKFAELTLSGIFEEMPPLDAGIEQLYRLNAHLFVLKTMNASAVGYYAHLAVSDTLTGIKEILKQPLADRSDIQIQDRLSETLHLVRRGMLTEEREQDAFSQSYYGILQNWAAPQPSNTEQSKEYEDVYESELQYLMDEERELGRSMNRQAWLGANAWSRFCIRQDDKAQALLTEAADKPYFSLKKLPDFLTPLAKTKQWDRLVHWLNIFGPLLERARTGLNDYGRLWDEALTQRPDAEPLMWETLSLMLPYAADFYESKLLERERWDDWMDYQLATGAEPANFKVTELAPIEKNAPEQLLPFYHQAVERFVEQRNRDGYKRAAKLLRRLEKLYKKMKQDERWDTFMELFNARYGRLRALQEELKKGKLMP
ncbi:hypothetical protein [Saccharibacillus sp. JS10]|uniref:hypothetical protein n=1 Tax=Saccharibacillus sp. JS10 TaxID=2950552 RepID=UPI00210D3646|nr:hypothetical protein [Saccharibacillus sp. JS10]MCQ4087648.1 hypothetical protein [Saccharibacillus sp. JS10]